MASNFKPTIGNMACLSCARSIPIKQAENGTLDLSCKECDFTGYAKAGTEAHALAMGRVKLREQPKPVPAAKAPPAPKTKPVPAGQPSPEVIKKNTLFG